MQAYRDTIDWTSDNAALEMNAELSRVPTLMMAGAP
jgi:hypothetical protein